MILCIFLINGHCKKQKPKKTLKVAEILKQEVNLANEDELPVDESNITE